MNISLWLQRYELQLKQSSIATSRLDALILLEDATGKDRAWLLAHPEYKLTSAQCSILNDQIERRAKHEPLAYIRGKSEFYGREFIVNEHTLEPRPETETMLDLLKQLTERSDLSVLKKTSTSKIKSLTKPKGPTFRLVDIGTGCGAIAIMTKLLFPEAKVFATDIDKKCIQIAKANAEKHNVSIDFRQGNLIEPLSNVDVTGSILLCNLPYVPDSHTINQAAMFEPKHAIFGGEDGLDLYREMFNQIDSLKNKPKYVITESLPFQHSDLAKIAEVSRYKQTNQQDFIQVFMYC